MRGEWRVWIVLGARMGTRELVLTIVYNYDEPLPLISRRRISSTSAELAHFSRQLFAGWGDSNNSGLPTGR